MPLEDYADMVKKCLRCSVCKWIPQIQIKSQKFATICPSIDRWNFHSYSGGGRIIVALSVLMNRIEYSDKLLDVVYKCTECGGCSISCKFLNIGELFKPEGSLPILIITTIVIEI